MRKTLWRKHPEAVIWLAAALLVFLFMGRGRW